MKLKIKRGKKTVKAARRSVRRLARPVTSQKPVVYSQPTSADFMETVKKYVIGEIPYEERFVTADGRSLRSVYELVDALGNMSDETFSYHVSEERNDFSAWISDSLKETELGEQARAAQTRVDMQIVLLKFLATRFR